MSDPMGIGKLIIDNDGQVSTSEFPFWPGRRIVIVINNQFTDSPNTTQIASGAGRSSSAGNNAAVAASNTLQQQSVGAHGEAHNTGMDGEQRQPHHPPVDEDGDETIVIIINNQINRTGESQAGATQVASGGAVYSAAGTNAAIESSNTKQQHAVGGDAEATNDGMNDAQIEQ